MGRQKPARRLLAQVDLENDAGVVGRQHIVAASLHPVVAGGWRAQAMAAPVFDPIAPLAVLRRQAAAAIEIVVRPRAAPTGLRVRWWAVTVMFGFFMLLPMFIPMVITMIFGHRKPAEGERHRSQGGHHQGFGFHGVLSL